MIATHLVDSFRAAIEQAGLTPPDPIIADGTLHRFPTNGHREDDSGWYVLHGDDIPAGVCGDWRTGERLTAELAAVTRLLFGQAPRRHR